MDGRAIDIAPAGIGQPMTVENRVTPTTRCLGAQKDTAVPLDGCGE